MCPVCNDLEQVTCNDKERERESVCGESLVVFYHECNVLFIGIFLVIHSRAFFSIYWCDEPD